MKAIVVGAATVVKICMKSLVPLLVLGAIKLFLGYTREKCRNEDDNPSAPTQSDIGRGCFTWDNGRLIANVTGLFLVHLFSWNWIGLWMCSHGHCICL